MYIIVIKTMGEGIGGGCKEHMGTLYLPLNFDVNLKLLK